MSAPLVSVCLSSYQYADHLAACVEGILAQEGVDLELVAIDDASTDGSWDLLRGYAGDPRVRLVRHERNAGFLATRAEGLALARGRYLVTFDADDLAIERTALRAQADLLGAEPRVGLACADFDIVDERGRRIGRRRVPFDRVTPGPAAFRVLLRGNRIMHSGTMFRRECVDAVGGYDARFEDCADWDLWLRIAARYDVGRVARPLYAYRLHGRNMFRRADPEERCRLVRHASSYAPASAAGDLRGALAAAEVTAAAVHLADGRYASAGRALSAAARRDPRSLADLALVRGAARAVLGGLLGPRRGTALVRKVQRMLAR